MPQLESNVEYYADRFTRLCLGESVPTMRPTFGDRVDLGPARMEIAAMLAYSPEVRVWIYEVGKKAGASLGTKLKERGILRDFLEGNITNPLGEFSLKPEDDGFIVRLSSNLFSEGLPNVGLQFDSFLAGALASLLSIETGQKMGAVERACYASGANSCEFLVFTVDSNRPVKTVEAPDERWKTAMEGLMQEYTARLSAGSRKKTLRYKLGDRVDLAVMRLMHYAILSFSPEVKAWLYIIGKRLGVAAADQQSKGLKGRLLNILFFVTLQLRGRVTLRRQDGVYGFEKKGKNILNFTIYECSLCYGGPKTEEHTGYFQGGMAAGRMERRTGKTVAAKEIMCASMGSPYCVYELKVLE